MNWCPYKSIVILKIQSNIPEEAVAANTAIKFSNHFLQKIMEVGCYWTQGVGTVETETFI